MLNKININNSFFIFITLHLLIWTLIPSLTNKNLPLDTIEALAWANNLDWGPFVLFRDGRDPGIEFRSRPSNRNHGS
mgnify:CR=1 FL=1